MKVIGVIDAGSKSAVKVLSNGEQGTIAVVETPGTVLSGAYEKAIRHYARELGLTQRIEIFHQGAYGLAGSIVHSTPSDDVA